MLPTNHADPRGALAEERCVRGENRAKCIAQTERLSPVRVVTMSANLSVPSGRNRAHQISKGNRRPCMMWLTTLVSSM